MAVKRTRSKSGPARVRQWREEAGLSLARAGELVGDRGGFQLCRYENGQIQKLPLRIAVALCRESGIRPGAIMPPADLEIVVAAQSIAQPRARGEYTRAT